MAMSGSLRPSSRHESRAEAGLTALSIICLRYRLLWSSHLPVMRVAVESWVVDARLVLKGAAYASPRVLGRATVPLGGSRAGPGSV